MSKPIYRKHMASADIIKDGWTRGFKPTQVQCELAGQGYLIHTNTIMKEYDRFNTEYEEDVSRREQEEYQFECSLFH